MKRSVLNSLFVATGAVMTMCATATINQKSAVAYAADTIASLSNGIKSLSKTITDAKGAQVTIGSGVFYIDSTVTTTTNLRINGDCTIVPSSGVTTMFEIGKKGKFTVTVEDGAKLTVGTDNVLNCRFLSSAGDISITGNTYIQNLSVSNGGVITSSSSSNPISATFTNVHFVNCSGGNGGALSIAVKKTIDIKNCSFEGCSGKNGGALYFCGMTGNNNLDIDNTYFKECSAENGGAIYTDGSASTVSLNNTSFEGNTAVNDGGALYVLGNSATVSGCTLNGNSAENGGAVYSTLEGLMSLNGTNVTNNDATFGGGVYVQSGDVSIDSHSEISKNNATAGGSGILLNSDTSTVNNAGKIDSNTVNGIEDTSGVEKAAGIDYDAAIKGLETQASLSFGFDKTDDDYTYFLTTADDVKKIGYIGIIYRTYLPMEVWKTVRSGIKSIGVEYGNASVSFDSELQAKDIKTYNKNVSGEGADCVSCSIRIQVSESKRNNTYYGQGYITDNKGIKHYLGETKREFTVMSLAHEYLNNQESLGLSESVIGALENLVR